MGGVVWAKIPVLERLSDKKAKCFCTDGARV